MIRHAEEVVYNKAMQAIADHDVKVIVRSMDVDGQRRRYTQCDPPHSVTLSHLIERVDECAKQAGELALLIADEVDGQNDYRRELWGYQRFWTPGYRARKITAIVDTIHFAPSSASRLLQAADLIAYMARRRIHVETDERARKANVGIWARIQPRIWHDECWWPMGLP
jgi:hypothetical protein